MAEARSPGSGPVEPGAGPAERAGRGADELARLEELVRTLRARCPWDRRQTHRSLAPHLLEEAYEALDTIELLARVEPTPDPAVVAHFREELGDVLFQVFFHAELASEKGRFTMADVAQGIHDKLVSRHPHVFGEATADTPEEVAARWEVLKRAEKQRLGVTDAIPNTMPALALMTKLLKKAASLGTPLPSTGEREEELRRALERLALEAGPGRTAREAGPGRTAGEAGPGGTAGEAGDQEAAGSRVDSEVVARVGEALVALVDLARRVGVDPETALRAQALRLRDELESGG